jgi:hypothetical protein
MEWTSTDVIGVISYLLPGFLAAWVFYGLTAHPRKSPFERVVQALIFTVIVQGLTTITRWALEWASQWQSLGPWTKEVSLVWSLVNAILLGLLVALFANKDWFHATLRTIGWTTRTSYPSEWFSAFNRDRRYVILHLEGGRRLHGWPFEWPDQADCGHFVVVEPSWVLDNNECAPLLTVERLLIPVKQVEMVEILKFANEISATTSELKSVEQVLVELQETGETEDGKQSTAAATAPKSILQSDGRARVGGQPAIESAKAANVPAPASKKRQMRNRNRRNGRQT